jgi:hypothetical protein
MTSIGDYNKIMSDRNIFNQVVYTPLSEAIVLLEERQKDTILVAKIEKLLGEDIPTVLVGKKCAVLNRQVATPNHESKRFILLAEESNLSPVFFEYHSDKFTPENDFKYSLGKLTIYNGIGKNGGQKKEYNNIIDFNKSNGKKLSEIPTTSSVSLVDFHKNLFSKSYNNIQCWEASEWFRNHGINPSTYYVNFFLLFTCHAILFENFLLEGPEKKFTEEIILPAIETVINLTGFKPIIVPLEPIDMESDGYWYYHNSEIKNIK